MKSFREVNQLLSSYVPDSGLSSGVYTLLRMKKLMKFLGNPQEQYQVIHVAGTSGKTSTSYYIAALLKASGKKTGLTVSPYVNEINERIQIGLEPLAEDAFANNIESFIELIEKSGIRPTYFELIVAFAYWYFAREKVDCAVIETGLGGLLDGTNVVVNPSKICVITDIGYDHTEILGSTLDKIAAQKAGIIHTGNQVFCLEQPPEIATVLRKVSSTERATLHEIQVETCIPCAVDLPEFQKRNWYLAYRVNDHISSKKIPMSQLQATTKTLIPGRMEIIRVGAKTIILDGAHNQQKMHAFVSSLKNKFPHQRYAVLFALTEKPDDEANAITKEIVLASDYLIATSFMRQQDLLRQPHNVKSIVACLRQLHFTDYEVSGDAESGLRALLNRPEEVLVVTGSIYLVASIRKHLVRNRRDA